MYWEETKFREGIFYKEGISIRAGNTIMRNDSEFQYGEGIQQCEMIPYLS
jgi:hypothetical protein